MSTSEALTAEPPAIVSTLFAPTTKRVVVEVDYAANAEPFVAPTASYESPWAIFRENADALFDGAKEVVVPSKLDEMERLTDLDATAFSEEDILAIAAKHQDTKPTEGTAAFYIVFLDGYLRDIDGSLLREVPGVALRGTNIVAIFKPAVTFDLHGPDSPAYMEQTTLVHEFGHAIGLVDRGIPSTTAHRAEPEGAHCANPSCIMYWQNVLVKDGVDFVDTYLKPRHGVLFGPECLHDIRVFEASQVATR